MVDQLAFSRPEVMARHERMTQRQRDLVEWVRLHSLVEPWEVRRLGYAAPSAALMRLVRRGLLARQARGYYVAVTPREVPGEVG